jgi:hypothetical protein
LSAPFLEAVSRLPLGTNLGIGRSVQHGVPVFRPDGATFSALSKMPEYFSGLNFVPALTLPQNPRSLRGIRLLVLKPLLSFHIPPIA